jgi:hypothetical protein
MAAALDGLLASLERLFAIPPGHRSDDVPRASALQVLGCDDAALDELLRRGLSHAGPAGDERFDANDLFNLALYSGAGRSVPERALRYAIRWMAESPEKLTATRRWTFSVTLSCARPDGCGADPLIAAALPVPELFGGRLEDVSIAPPPERGDEAGVECAGSEVQMTATVETRGELRTIRSPRLRAIVDEVLGSGLRWVKVPASIHARPELLLPHGVATCTALSLHLAERCREAGFEARTRRGWMLGMLDLIHAWLEVEDEDGETKVVDPIFVLLAGLAPDAHPELPELCRGSVTNRLLPTTRAAGEPIDRHTCDGAEAPLAKRTTILPAREPAAAPN